MMTSNFTLEYSNIDGKVVGTGAQPVKPAPNIRRTSMPTQLHRLGVSERVWLDIYNRADGVAERAVIRENNKRELDEWASNQKGSKDRKAGVWAKVALDKENHDKNTSKGWMNLLNECSIELGVYGISASLMTDAHTNLVFGVDFRCNASKLLPNKLKLEFDHRTGKWSWPRDEIPAELAALHVDNKVWSSVWDRAKLTYDESHTLESGKDVLRVVQSNYNLAAHHHELGSRTEYSNALREMNMLDRAIESEWGYLLESAEDALYLWGISVALSFEDRNAKAKYCGIILRFKPIASTVRVLNESAVVVPLPSAPRPESAADETSEPAMVVPLPSAPCPESFVEETLNL